MTWLEFWSSFKSENHFPPFCEIFTFCDRLEDGSIQKVSGQGVMCPNPPTFNVKFGSIIPKLTEWQSWISHWKVIHSTSMFPILLHETDVGRTRATVDGVMVHLSYVQWDYSCWLTVKRLIQRTSLFPPPDLPPWHYLASALVVLVVWRLELEENLHED